MKFEGEFVCDRKYYQTFYRDWRRHSSRWGNFDLILGLACLAAGIFVVVDPTRRGPLGFVLLAIGCWEVPRALSRGYRWVSKQLTSDRAHKKFEFKLDGNLFVVKRQGDLQSPPQSPVKQLIVADEGILLTIEKGKTVYLPKYAFPTMNDFAACATYLSSSQPKAGKHERQD